MAKITDSSATISTTMYPRKVLDDLVAYGDFYIANVEGKNSIGMETCGDVIVYGLVNQSHDLVQGFLVDRDSLVLPYNCLTTWAAYGDEWKRVDINKFMQDNPSSRMDERFNHFLEWLGNTIETDFLKEKIRKWNAHNSNVPPTNYDDFVNNDYEDYILPNNSYGQDIVFDCPSDVVKSVKSGMYKGEDKYLYVHGIDVISFSSRDDATAPWNKYCY